MLLLLSHEERRGLGKELGGVERSPGQPNAGQERLPIRSGFWAVTTRTSRLVRRQGGKRHQRQKQREQGPR